MYLPNILSKKSQKLSILIILIFSLFHMSFGVAFRGTEYKFSERREFQRAFIEEFYDS